MTMIELSIGEILGRGLVWGLVGALLGSLLFGLIASPVVLWEFSRIPLPDYKPRPDTPTDLVHSYLQEGLVGSLLGIKDLLSSFMFAGTVSFICSAVPGALGGMALGILVHFGAVRLPFPGRMGVSMAVGGLIGGTTGLLLVSPISLLPSPDSAALIMEWLVPLIALACGAWVGWRVASSYQQVQSKSDDRRFPCPLSISEELPILRPFLRGLGWGLIACALFNFVFSAIGILLFEMDLINGMASFITSTVPAAWGGILFSISLYFISRASLPTPTKVLLISIIGGVLGFLITEPIVLTVAAFSYTQSIVFRVSQVILGFLTAAVIRTWVRRQLASGQSQRDRDP
jgi:hypothetical protein